MKSDAGSVIMRAMLSRTTELTEYAAICCRSAPPLNEDLFDDAAAVVAAATAESSAELVKMYQQIIEMMPITPVAQ